MSYYRNSLMWLWKLRNPSSSSWRTRKARGIIQTESKGLRIWGPKTQEPIVPKSESKAGKFTFSPHFYSIQALSWLDDACSHWGRWSPLLGLLIQFLISSWDTLASHRNNILPAFQASLHPVKLTHRTNHHRCWLRICVSSGKVPGSLDYHESEHHVQR